MALFVHHRRAMLLQFGCHFLLFPLFLFSAFPSSAHGLNCYQGLANISAPIAGSPTQCVGVAFACVKTVDFNSGQVTRSCLATNCTIQMGQNQMTTNNQQQQQQAMSMVPLCINNTASTFCCCYGDGCNSALAPTLGDGTTMASLLRHSIPMLAALLLLSGGIL